MLFNALRRRVLLLLLLSGAACGAAQPPGAPAEAPRREVRAVWITTLLGLDWPKSLDPAEQQRSLRAIVRELARARYNTVFFQVRGRADAMYRSLFEPWAQQLTGTLGKDPGWDPLEFLVREAHGQGLEVHAWFNTFVVGGGKDRPPGSLHVAVRHPEWVREANGESWLDPGIPEVRDYLVRVGLDIVRNYDIDGFQFDFIRYPAAPYPDDETYRAYGAGRPKADWRRENVTSLVAAFRDSLASIKPFVKLGATPLGVYRNADGAVRGLQSYDEVYQDSRGWLSRGLVDYLVPQVYWSMGDRPGNPDFARLAREWSEHAYGRQIILGIGAYKPEVEEQLGGIIDLARSVGVAGHSFFRYTNVAGREAIAGRYQARVNAPAMAWKDSRPPAPLQAFRAERMTNGDVRLSWEKPADAGAQDGGPIAVNIYRSPRRRVDANEPGALLAVAPLAAGEFTDSSGRGDRGTYTYALAVLDRANNESSLAGEFRLLPPDLLALAKKVSARFSLGAALRSGKDRVLFVPYEVGGNSPVSIAIFDDTRRRVGSVVDDLLEPGRYVAAADIAGLRKGSYTVVMAAGDYREERRFLVE